jgi:hypothetical protein
MASISIGMIFIVPLAYYYASKAATLKLNGQHILQNNL